MKPSDRDRRAPKLELFGALGLLESIFNEKIFKKKLNFNKHPATGQVQHKIDHVFCLYMKKSA
jgi:hypothetical protein